MKIKLFAFLPIALCFIQACDDKQPMEITQPFAGSSVQPGGKPALSIHAYNNTKGYRENGQIITEFDCPDDRSFPPIDIKLWEQTPAVNGRLPTYEETTNGTSIHHYGEKENSFIKPYGMLLPRLAYYENGPVKYVFDSESGKEIVQPEVVVVIQIVQTATDTAVAYRYLTGGCGGSKFHKFHFLSDEEVRKAVGKGYQVSLNYKK